MASFAASPLPHLLQKQLQKKLQKHPLNVTNVMNDLIASILIFQNSG